MLEKLGEPRIFLWDCLWGKKRFSRGGGTVVLEGEAIAQYSPLYFTSQGQAVIYGNWAEIIDELGSHCSFVVKDTETEELLEVYKQNDQWTLYPAGTPTSEAQKPVGWARSLGNFMGVVSSPYGDKVSNCYRFERIE